MVMSFVADGLKMRASVRKAPTLPATGMKASFEKAEVAKLAKAANNRRRRMGDLLACDHTLLVRKGYHDRRNHFQSGRPGPSQAEHGHDLCRGPLARLHRRIHVARLRDGVLAGEHQASMRLLE